MEDVEKPKRPSRKPAVKPPAAAPRTGRRRKTICLDADVARRLAVYAASLGRDQSDIVAEALEPMLRGFYWGQRGVSDPPPVIEPLLPRLAVGD